MGRGEEDRRRGRLRRETLRRVKLRDPLAERLDDAPPACVGAGRHRQSSAHDHPERRPAEVGVELAGRDERERDDPHRLLRVVRSVREGDEATGHELEPPEDAVDETGRAPPDDPDEHEHDRGRTEHPEQRGQERGDQDLLDQPVPLDNVEPGSCDRGSGDASDQRVTRARRQAEIPGEQVPGDRADEPGQKHLQGDPLGTDDSLRDRGRHLERDERPGEVQDRRTDDGGTRRQRSRRDARCDRVRSVVEAVREVEEERHHDDCDEREIQCCPAS